jgi:hypothetical protein
MRIEVGQMLKTNYGTGPFRITSIVRGCTCIEPVDWHKEIHLPSHLHMRARYVTGDHNDGDEAWLGFYDESTLRSVLPGSNDQLVPLENASFLQTSLAL